jgi:hypothetical protein
MTDRPVASGYLSPRDAAAYLGVTERTLTEWRRTGRGPRYTRLGAVTGRVRYAVRDLDRYMRTRSHANTAAETAMSDSAGEGREGDGTPLLPGWIGERSQGGGA